LNFILNAQQNNFYSAGSTTFDSLPDPSIVGAGARYFITDSNTATFLATAAGGGAFAVPVVSNGTDWLVG